MSHPVDPTTTQVVPVSTTALNPPLPVQGLTPEALKLIEDANKRAEAAQNVAADLQAKFDETANSLKDLSKDAAERKTAEDAAKAEAEAAAKAAADEEAKKLRDAEEEKLDVRALLEKREAEFNNKLASFERQAAEKQALMEMEVKFQQLVAYTQGKIADNKDEILPEFYDYITGTTPEEVDASVELAKQKSQSVAAAAKAARTGARATAPGVGTKTGPSEMGSVPELPGDDTSEEGILRQLANDNPNAMANYAKLRDRLNIGHAGTGLFG